MLKLLNPNALRPPAVATLPTARPDVRYFDLHGAFIAFDANGMAAVQLDHALWDRAQADPAALGGLLGATAMPQFPLLSGGGPRKLVLNLTHACNLACRYCFVKSDKSDRSDLSDPSDIMSPATAREALRLLRGDLDICFFGGEPLLAWETLVAAVEAAEALATETRRAARFHVTTNGVALTAEKAAFLAAHKFSVLVSCDGPEPLHNAARPAKGGANSWRATMAALDLLREAGLASVSLRGTFTLDAPRLRERLVFYGELLDRGLVRGFSLEPAVITEGCARRDGGALDAEALADEYHAAAEWYLARVRAGRPAGFFHFRKLLERLRDARPQPSECGAGNGYVAVGPAGDLFACHRETGTHIGRLDIGIDEALRARWADNRLYRRRGCLDCFARWVCGGGCRQHAAELGRPLCEPNETACAIMQIMVRECLWIMTQT